MKIIVTQSDNSTESSDIINAISCNITDARDIIELIEDELADTKANLTNLDKENNIKDMVNLLYPEFVEVLNKIHKIRLKTTRIF